MSKSDMKDAFSKSSINYNQVSPDILEKCKYRILWRLLEPAIMSELAAHLRIFDMHAVVESFDIF